MRKSSKAKSRLNFVTSGGEMNYDILNKPDEVIEAVKRAMETETLCTLYGEYETFVVNPEDFQGGFSVTDLNKQITVIERRYPPLLKDDAYAILRGNVEESREAYSAIRERMLDDCEGLLTSTTEIADIVTMAVDAMKQETTEKEAKTFQLEKMQKYIDDRIDGFREVYGDNLPKDILESFLYIKRWISLVFSNISRIHELPPEPPIFNTVKEIAVATEVAATQDIDPATGAILVEA